MKKLFSFLMIILFSFNFLSSGDLILIGGGKRPKKAVKKFVHLVGNGKIIVIPTASSVPKKSSEGIIKEIRKYGNNNIEIINIKKKNQANDNKVLKKVKKAKGIYFTGGDQRRITKAIYNTELHKLIKKKAELNGIIAGTSAGTAAMSELMITGDGNFEIIEKENIVVWKGLGLLNKVIVDQHFLKRRRNNRLLSVILERPEFLGIGIDESSAVWINSNKTIEVLGGQIVIYEVDKKDIIEEKGKLGTEKMVQRILTMGYKYNLEHRQILN